LAVNNITEAFVLARVDIAKSGFLAPGTLKASGANTSEFTLDTVVITVTIVLASTAESTILRKVRKGILTIISEVRARTRTSSITTARRISPVALTVVLARVGVAKHRIGTSLAFPSNSTYASVITLHSVVVANTVIAASVSTILH